MGKLSLKEAAGIAGVPVGTLRMHILRGKLKGSSNEGRVKVDPADLEAYMVAERLKDAITESAGRPSREIYASLGEALAPLPPDVKDKILR